jgi:hypothetical protein
MGKKYLIKYKNAVKFLIINFGENVLLISREMG